MSTAIAIGSKTLQLPAEGESYSLALLNGNFQNIADEVNPQGKLPKGLVFEAHIPSSSGMVLDAIINNIASFTFKANRKYEIVWDFSYYGTGNSDSLFYCNVALAPVGDAAASLSNLTVLEGRTKGLLTSYALGSTQHTGPITIRHQQGPADATYQIKFRVQRVLGDDGFYVVANGNERAHYSIYDHGEASGTFS